MKKPQSTQQFIEWLHHISMDETYVQDLFREYLRYHQLSNTSECFEAELKAKQFTARPRPALTPQQLAELPRVYNFAGDDRPRAAKESQMEQQIRQLEKVYNVLGQTSRQLFAIAVDSVERLAAVDDRNPGEKDSAATYKAQLGKFHGVIMTEALAENSHAWFNEANLDRVKGEIAKGMKAKDYTAVLESLVTLRANALAVQPAFRRKILEQMVKSDVFSSQCEALVSLRNHEVRTSALALISMLASTGKGVAYVLAPRPELTVQSLAAVARDEEPGSVTQRFALGALQKIVTREESLCPGLLQSGLIGWIVTAVLEKGLVTGEFMHTFCLNFSSALLVNLLTGPAGLSYVTLHPEEAVQICDKLLELLIVDSLPTSVLLHLLLVLASVTSQRSFRAYLSQIRLIERVSDIVERFSQIKNEDAADPQTRAAVLDLCAFLHRLTPDHEASRPPREAAAEDEQEELIFECFPDEVSLM